MSDVQVSPFKGFVSFDCFIGGVYRILSLQIFPKESAANGLAPLFGLGFYGYIP